ncbi:hypothetical protein [Shewanella khirikhana]|uniref:Uncharacterized protein n=1 Tax=Shewanella khirikhana TaxID=1965282 RepID=A0ABM7DRH5_9GAMM|nr:hypothetical protein [Shewanella khirikhana]AZQ12301.1 hypothetical protein STH12_03241 [Shewanella khirikhana]
MRVVHHSDAYLDDIGLIVEPRQALANIRSSLRREPGCHPYISGLDSMLCDRGLGACITPHQVDNLLEDIRPLINRGDYFLLSGRGDLEGVLFFERSSPFLSNEFQHKLQSLPPRPQWSAASTSNSSSSFFEDAIDGLVGAGKQVLNDFIAGQRASQAEWFAEQGIIQATDKATGQALSSEELAERYREIETVSISPAQQGGADAIQSLRGYEAGLLVAEAAVNRKKIITDAKEIKDAIVDAVKDTKAQTKVDLDDIGSTAADLGVTPNKLDDIFQKVPEVDYFAIKGRSLHNADSATLVLGKYRPTITNGVEDWSVPGPDSYVAIARTENATYFDLGSEWGSVTSKYGLSDDDMFRAFNIPVLDDAVNAGKQIKFSHDPRTNGGFLLQEWEYLQNTHGYKRLREVDGVWYAK